MRTLLQDLRRIERAYLECALWAGSDWRAVDNVTVHNPEPLDKTFGLEDLSNQAIGTARLDCAAFEARFAAELERSGADPEQVGHDLFLSRNGHGAGFFARDDAEYPEDVRDTLQEGARQIGECELEPGDDGLLYFLGSTAL